MTPQVVTASWWKIIIMESTKDILTLKHHVIVGILPLFMVIRM